MIPELRACLLQVVLGSLPHADGNFDRPSDFTTTVVDGMWNLTTEQLEEFAGQVGYIVPASKSASCLSLHRCFFMP